MRIVVLSLFISLVSAFNVCVAQDIILTPAESLGAAGVVSVPTSDMSSSTVDVVNPSVMSRVSRFGIVASYAKPYGLDEIRQVSMRSAIATPLVNIALQAGKSGDDDSHFTTVGGGLSKRFSKWGMGFEYYALIHSLDDNKKYVSSYSRAGIHVEPNGHWLVSLAVHSIERRQIDYESSHVSIEPVAWLGVRWHGTDLLAVLFEAEKPWDSDAIGKMAVVVSPIQRLNVTLGFSTKGQSLSAGLGYMLKGFCLNAGLSYHDRLGVSSGAAVGFIIDK